MTPRGALVLFAALLAALEVHASGYGLGSTLIVAGGLALTVARDRWRRRRTNRCACCGDPLRWSPRGVGVCSDCWSILESAWAEEHGGEIPA